MWKKLASLIAGSVIVSSCTTPQYRPICDPGFEEINGRCAKVPKIIKVPKPRRVAVEAPQQSIAAPAWTQPSPRRAQNVY